MKKLFLAAFIFGCFTLQSNAATTSATSLWPTRNYMTVAEFVEYLRSVNPFLSIEELRAMAEEYVNTFASVFSAITDDKNKNKNKDKGEIVGEDDPRPYSLY